ncbi:DUF4230 domain-containing protein [Rasiella rasia]|uniref:DUF4230 domain-containing protein n=1 Tax=Rasiella rasia TaxID=2744027 RepID=A0A6G6GP52_9FLAO|nr:DUF4230 domain-containing protein [Rasiella rasia]QIE60250.1 DUF4230 domain-containing protein [Rasiella rasia]
MRKIVLGIIICLVIVFGLQYCEHQKEAREQLDADTALIEKQVKNVGKLIVTEGSYAQVFTYKDTEKLLGFIDANKKALVVVNAEATISYDLSKIVTEIKPEIQTVIISNIPEAEVKINPNIEYYDVTQDYLNQFEAEDYNAIKKKVEASLRKKIMASDLVSNAENRLISELQKIYILTNSMGWTLQYNQTTINTEAGFEKLAL